MIGKVLKGNVPEKSQKDLSQSKVSIPHQLC
jgi:hypothetical protein